MTLQATSSVTDSPVEPTQVIEFLRDNPAFFEDNPEALTELRVSHPTGKAVSLIERQVELLRDQNAVLKERLLDLVQVARDNDRLNNRIHLLLMALLDADSLNRLVDTLHEHLHTEFNADAVALHLRGFADDRIRESGACVLGDDDRARALFAAPLDSGKPLCGGLRPEQLDYLFGERAQGIESAAVIPFGGSDLGGLIAIGSREQQRFFPGMGTVFLGHLGELVGRLTARIQQAR